MRKLIRTIARTGRDKESWPVLVLLIAVVLPCLCLLWFMNAAMRNERLAVRQELADIHRAQLISARAEIDRFWRDTTSNLKQLVESHPPSAAFARAVNTGLADGVIIRDENRAVIYPTTPTSPADHDSERQSEWAEASRLEFTLRDFAGAARLYHKTGVESSNIHSAARAFQAEARCLIQANEVEAALALVNESIADPAYNRALDLQGRVIAANADLMFLEFSKPQSPEFVGVLARLKTRLLDYDDSALPASQRRFLMKRVLEIGANKSEFPTYAGEELAARSLSGLATDSEFAIRGGPDGSWQLAFPDSRVIALWRHDTLANKLAALLVSDSASASSAIAVLPPGVAAENVFVSIPVGSVMPGWQLTASFPDSRLFEAAANQRAALRLWTAVAVIASLAVLSILAIRVFRRQIALARLKNDLAATVSHELKTPLSSMRMLVDTLLDDNQPNQTKVREYLELIAKENERLSRLIENFLTFSRIEQKQYRFHFQPVPPSVVAASAIDAVAKRFNLPGCRLTLDAREPLPVILADPDALSSALVNLLDNSFKYSGPDKQVLLHVVAEDGQVAFAVEDNGIGIAKSELEKIFTRFYQVDERLSRTQPGCGLGLSIVQLIASAHNGSVSADSKPGHGSTFTIRVPIAKIAGQPLERIV